jgi:hypothetical protein
MTGSRHTGHLRLFLALAALAACAGAALAQPAQRSGRSRRPGGLQLQAGQPAPDFELPPLTFTRNEKGEQIGQIGKNKVKLSDFKGKAPVCIFSSSYT